MNSVNEKSVVSSASSVNSEIFEDIIENEVVSPASSISTEDISRAVMMTMLNKSNEIHKLLKSPHINSSSRDSLIQVDSIEDIIDNEDDDASGEKKKRRRTNPFELSILEKHFNIDPLPDSTKRAKIAQEIGNGMTVRAVQIWFQNKRQTLKKKALLAQYDELKKFQSEKTDSKRIPLGEITNDLSNRKKQFSVNRVKDHHCSKSLVKSTMKSLRKSKSLTLASSVDGSATIVSLSSLAFQKYQTNSSYTIKSSLNTLGRPKSSSVEPTQISISSSNSFTSNFHSSLSENAPNPKKLKRSNSSFCPVHGKIVGGVDVEKGSKALSGLLFTHESNQPPISNHLSTSSYHPHINSISVDERECAQLLIELRKS